MLFKSSRRCAAGVSGTPCLPCPAGIKKRAFLIKSILIKHVITCNIVFMESAVLSLKAERPGV
ncbi:hypothetical protein EcCFBP13530_22785 [Enterobacter cancerogenus]|uniref:Uncharacterized protein n=1 Tax=Enterobacter cancerogenus TaxID=69218 RepID=A0AB38NY40_9ENTR|nr:hypothetical protein EcCFBP13530_22785 [Enterobacter cancerogenus]